MEWLGSEPDESHLPHIAHESEVCGSAKARAAVMSAGRPACFYTWPLDRLQHCSSSLSLLFSSFVLEEVSNRGEQRGWVRNESQECKESVKGGRDSTLSWSHVTERIARTAGVLPRGSSLGDPPPVNTSALCHDRLLFWCSYHAGLLAMSQWSRRQYWIIWFVSQSSVLPLFQQRFFSMVDMFVIWATKDLWFLEQQFDVFGKYACLLCCWDGSRWMVPLSQSVFLA